MTNIQEFTSFFINDLLVEDEYFICMFILMCYLFIILCFIVIGVTLSMKDCPKTHEVGEYITKVPYASTMRVIVYDMLFACSNIIYALGVTS